VSFIKKSFRRLNGERCFVLEKSEMQKIHLQCILSDKARTDYGFVFLDLAGHQQIPRLLLNCIWS
jgi:hypothetical protein